MNRAYKQMCETIAEAGFLRFKGDDRAPTAAEVFNYSPTGELFKITEWYARALAVLGRGVELAEMAKEVEDGCEKLVGEVAYNRLKKIGELAAKHESKEITDEEFATACGAVP